MAVAPTDLDQGSFSDAPPWTIDDPEALTWRRGLDEVRARVLAEVPALTTPGRWPPGARLAVVARRLGTAVGLWRLREKSAGGEVSRAGISRRLRLAAERLGPTYIKLGQIISSGEGIFPPELVDEFKLCRDQVPAEPFRVVREVVEADLGRPLDEVFRWVDRTPLAAASIAQVHAATLRTGERVVVKVQRPAVAELVHDDLRVMAWLAPKLVGRIPIAALANPPALVELFAQTIAEELDFRLEAENMLDVARTFAELGQRGYVIPRPHPTLVTPRVLVMERLDGFRFDDVVGMRGAGVDTEAVVRTGMIGFVEGAILHGIFHGDLHGGNLFVLPDGRTALLDFGITGRLDDTKRVAFLRLLMAGSANDVRSQLVALRDLGVLPPDADLDQVVRELHLDQPPIDPATMSGEQLVGELQQIIKALLGLGAHMPKELMLFVKNMVFIDGAIARLAPDLDLFGEIAQLSLYFATRHGDRILADVGIDPRAVELDLSGVRASFGVDDATEKLTHRELRQRRETIRRNLSERGRSRRR
ncbi:MAG: AarF/ABC1/UbiB kinase family protein [Acidimicrobiales bacterium]|nr:AarF/ABC1/UbiB kinase family protein [Acidimicrobiales bacterium]